MAAEACILLDRGTGARLENKTTASAKTRYGAGLPRPVLYSLCSEIAGRFLCFLLDGESFLWLFISNLKSNIWPL